MSWVWFFLFLGALYYAHKRNDTVETLKNSNKQLNDELLEKRQQVNLLNTNITTQTQKSDAELDYQWKMLAEREKNLKVNSNHKELSNRDLIKQAEVMKSEALQIKLNAEHSIEKFAEENKAFHIAVEEIANLWVNDSWKAISEKLTATNFAQQKKRLETVFKTIEKYGLSINQSETSVFFDKLTESWKHECEIEKAKEDQARIREIMREEQRAEKLRAAELKQLEQERKQLEAKQREQTERIRLLQEMESLKQLTDQQKTELKTALQENAQLQQELVDSARKQSMAEQTKAGHIYVISNYGSFGRDVYKVGMTRRIYPDERVKELGDASVPFPFDIHLMIATENAPELESKIHEELWNHRMNLVNDRKEFFNIDIQTIKSFVDKHGGGVIYEFKEHPEAPQWRETVALRQEGQLGAFKVISSTDGLGEEEEAA